MPKTAQKSSHFPKNIEELRDLQDHQPAHSHFSRTSHTEQGYTESHDSAEATTRAGDTYDGRNLPFLPAHFDPHIDSLLNGILAMIVAFLVSAIATDWHIGTVLGTLFGGGIAFFIASAALGGIMEEMFVKTDKNMEKGEKLFKKYSKDESKFDENSDEKYKFVQEIIKNDTLPVPASVAKLISHKNLALSSWLASWFISLSMTWYFLAVASHAPFVAFATTAAGAVGFLTSISPKLSIVNNWHQEYQKAFQQHDPDENHPNKQQNTQSTKNTNTTPNQTNSDHDKHHDKHHDKYHSKYTAASEQEVLQLFLQLPIDVPSFRMQDSIDASLRAYDAIKSIRQQYPHVNTWADVDEGSQSCLLSLQTIAKYTHTVVTLSKLRSTRNGSDTESSLLIQDLENKVHQHAEALEASASALAKLAINSDPIQNNSTINNDAKRTYTNYIQQLRNLSEAVVEVEDSLRNKKS